MTVNRRDATKLMLAGAGASAVPVAVSARSNQDWRDQLQAELESALQPGCGGVFDVRAFGQGKQSDGQLHFACVVQLDWPPGFRRRRFDEIAHSESAAYNGLANKVLFYFAKTWPGCVV